ncbi:surface antigen BspA-like [Trichomonas vaginalis G3]|uniref:Surface antigen BspA-like n=1 Tax=Trichomonas vaginalis (strain ATCC PRA-98 / G3) TaxID=412133 RepID=A2DCH2_TRIV3|nr:surface antigen BspA-like [Trichomonas vaginalis G3]|eukprot:XP_001582895.1 surface antigen BspA-like [Trichomonas vaginalis G3]
MESVLQKIGGYCFANTKISSIYIPRTLTSITATVFQATITMQDIRCDPMNSKFCSQDDVLYNYDMTSIVYFPANKSKSIVIPESVISVEYCCFLYSSIETVEFPPKIKNLWGYSFSRTNLRSITIPNSVTYMADGVFAYCKLLNEIIFGNGVNYISEYCFYGTNISSITIPYGYKKVGGNAFFDCPNLKNVILPSTITDMGGSAFPLTVNFTFDSGAQLTIDDQRIMFNLDKTKLIMCLNKSDSYTIPEQVQIINENAFKDNPILRKIVFKSNSNLNEIGKNAFANCLLLSSIDIPISTSNFLDGAFSGCSSITTVFFGKNLISISDNAFSYCTSLSSVIFNECDQNASIKINSFRGCSSLSTLTLSARITRIEMYCFADCIKLTILNLPSTLIYIGIYAFSNNQ